MAPAADLCLVCNGPLGATASNVFEKGMLGLQPLKERLQVVLQVELEEATCHSGLLCRCCEEKMEDIDDYQCSVDAFRESFQQTLEYCESQAQSVPNTTVCLVCHQSSKDNKSKNIFAKDNLLEPGLKDRLETVLLLVLDPATCRSPLLCTACENNLAKIDSDRTIVNEFASTFHQTKALYASGDSNNNNSNGQKTNSEATENCHGNGQGVMNGQRVNLSESFSSTASSDLETTSEDQGESNGVGDGSELILRNKDTFECAYSGCSYQNTRLCHIKTHVRLHTGWKPFLCDYCNRRFSDKSNCSKHQRRCYYKSQAQLQGHMKVLEDCQGYFKSGMDRYRGQPRPEVNGFIQSHQFQGHFKGMENNGLKGLGHVKVAEEGVAKRQVQNHFNFMDGYVRGHTQVGDMETTEDEYECSVCSAVFATAGEATTHMRIHSNNADVPLVNEGQPPNKIPLDGTEDGEPIAKRAKKMPDVGLTLSDNLIIENNGLFVCTVCNYQRPSFKHVQSHARTHTGEKPFVCSFCGGRFSDPSNYNRHVNKHLSGENVKVPVARASKSIRIDPSMIPLGQSDSDIEEGDQSPIQKRIKPFECSMCRDSFDNAVDLTEHIRNHMEGEGTSPKAKHVSQDPAEAFNNVKSMVLDVGQHGGGDTTEAGDRSGKTDDSVEDGGNKDTDDEDPNQVSEAYRDSLIVYDDARAMYRCNQCRYENNILYNLRKHIRTHTGEKPYKCDFCDQRFADKSNQRKHERKHHVEGKTYEYTNEQPVADPTPVVPVVNTKRFKCDKCSVSFRYAETLQKHQELHEGDEPFNCPVCPKTFLNSTDLQRHVTGFHPSVNVENKSESATAGTTTQSAVVGDENNQVVSAGTKHPFRCTDCGVVFATSTNLQQHSVKEHGRGVGEEESEKPRSTSEGNPTENEKNDGGRCRGSQSGETIGSVAAAAAAATGSEQDSEGSQSEFGGEPSPMFHLLQAAVERTASGFRCKLCGEEKARLADMRNHQRSYHTETELYSFLQKNGERMNGERMNLMFDAGKGYLCKVCPFKSYFITKMRRHIRSVHGMDAALEASVPSGHTLMHKNSATGYFECLICGVRHRAATHLMTHIKNKHPAEFNTSQDGGSGREDMDIPMSDDPPTVGGSKSGKAARRISEETLVRLQQQQQQQQQEKRRILQHQQLQAQLLQQQQLQQQQLKQQMQKQQLKQHLKKQQELQLKQKQLQQQQQQLLKEQQRLHQPFRCAMCSEAFHEPGDLQVHFGEHCRGQVYPFTEVLKTQVAREGVKKLHPCPHCGAVYIHPQNMQRHLLTHSVVNSPSGLQQQFPLSPNPSMVQQQFQMSQVLMPSGILDQLGSMQMLSPSGGTGNFRCPVCYSCFMQPQQLMVHMELHQQQVQPQQVSLTQALSPGVVEIQPPLQTMKLPTKTEPVASPFSQFLKSDASNSSQVIKIEPDEWSTVPPGGQTMKLPVTIGTICPLNEPSEELEPHSSTKKMQVVGESQGDEGDGSETSNVTDSSGTVPITIEPNDNAHPQLALSSLVSFRNSDIEPERNVEDSHQGERTRVEESPKAVSESPTAPSGDGDRKLGKPAVCSLCGATFLSKMNYLNHLQSHTKFNCPTCGVCFQEISELYEHFDHSH